MLVLTSFVDRVFAHNATDRRYGKSQSRAPYGAADAQVASTVARGLAVEVAARMETVA